ncbi:sensor histidine kinase [Baaleninema sp.]|uniref:sensor histidine kinase n=1 Tax=Baaleninema sp. TaxID=3101197 RepID=UPI003D068C1D
MLATTPLEDKQRKYVKYISSSGMRLQSMVDSLLMMAKVYAGKLQLHRQPVDFIDLARTVLDEFDTIAERKHIKLVSDFPEEERTLDLDKTICHRVLDNLLANAIKFSPQGALVEMAIEYLPNGDVCLCITDSGPGVKPEIQQQIFETFEIGQVMEGISQTGLGLAFCKTAVEAHGGKISVENRTPRGAVFTLILPGSGDEGMRG